MITHDIEEAVFLPNRIYALGARPGTVRRVMTIDLTKSPFFSETSGYFP